LQAGRETNLDLMQEGEQSEGGGTAKCPRTGQCACGSKPACARQNRSRTCALQCGRTRKRATRLYLYSLGFISIKKGLEKEEGAGFAGLRLRACADGMPLAWSPLGGYGRWRPSCHRHERTRRHSFHGRARRPDDSGVFRSQYLHRQLGYAGDQGLGGENMLAVSLRLTPPLCSTLGFSPTRSAVPPAVSPSRSAPPPSFSLHLTPPLLPILPLPLLGYRTGVGRAGR